MRRFFTLFAVSLVLLLAGPLGAQKQPREPLTEAQIEQIREAGIAPAERIKLYAKFAAEHVDKIKALANRIKSPDRAKKLDDELQDLTTLFDELCSNLDQYAERRADLRKALQPLDEQATLWLNSLRALAGEPGFDVARKEAIESGDDLADEAHRLLSEQNAYFQEHKDESGQQRAEPQ